MSCNGCRILRKACPPNCLLKPCLQWIASPESQANAALFLAKFYGRAGLLNLIAAASSDHRPDTFRSLLYEAAGRVINPVDGAVGLLKSGNWARCQAAVDAVLQGSPISANAKQECPIHGVDIRHVKKDDSELNRNRIRYRNKRTPAVSNEISAAATKFTITGWESKGEYSTSFRSVMKRGHSFDDSLSVETVEQSLLRPSPPRDVTVKLTLGL